MVTVNEEKDVSALVRRNCIWMPNVLLSNLKNITYCHFSSLTMWRLLLIWMAVDLAGSRRTYRMCSENGAVWVQQDVGNSVRCTFISRGLDTSASTGKIW